MTKLQLNGSNEIYVFDHDEKSIRTGQRLSDKLRVIAKKINQNRDTYPALFRQLSLIKHRAIPNSLDLIQDNGKLYLIREYYEGMSLKELLSRKALCRKLGKQFFIHLFIELLSALEELHRHHILHLDLKPANILIRHSLDESPRAWQPQNVLLIDFEQALSFPVEYGHRNRFTLVYSPPEQLLNRLHLLRPASDLSALGIILYEIFAGSPPYVDCNAELLLNLQLTYPLRKRASVPDELFSIIQKASHKSRFPRPPRLLDHTSIEELLKNGMEGRYQNCGEMSAALRHYASSLNTGNQTWWKSLLQRIGLRDSTTQTLPERPR